MSPGRRRRPVAHACLAIAVALAASTAAAQDNPCVWDHFKDARFDLRALMRKDAPYHILDGDDPCTRIEEEAYDYYFNLCADVPDASTVPSECQPNWSSEGGRGAALQYNPRTKKCQLIGEYKPSQDEYMWRLYDDTDPSKGVTIKYEGSKKALCSNGAQRTFTVDVLCANHMTPVVVSAFEPEHCQYHAKIQSVHGCPKECPTTSNGLCDSHGHCAFDPTARSPHCYCNEGRGGVDCSKSMSSSPSPQHSYSVQMGLLITLLIFIIALVGVVGYMVLQVYSYRKDAAGKYTAFQGELSRMGGGF